MEAAGIQAITMAVLALSAGTATAIDLARRRIPNALTTATAATGLGLAAAGVSGLSLRAAVAGLILGLLLMLPGYAFGATGAGDVKLFAASGTLLGAARMPEAFLFAALAGGVLALGTACLRGRLAWTLGGIVELWRRPAEGRARIVAPGDNRFPYGPAIAAGCVLAALR